VAHCLANYVLSVNASDMGKCDLLSFPFQKINK
jgi:hypothetical protein